MQTGEQRRLRDVCGKVLRRMLHMKMCTAFDTWCKSAMQMMREDIEKLRKDNEKLRNDLKHTQRERDEERERRIKAEEAEEASKAVKAKEAEEAETARKAEEMRKTTEEVDKAKEKRALFNALPTFVR